MDHVTQAKNSVRSDPLHPAYQKNFSAANKTLQGCVAASEATGVLMGSLEL